MDLSIQCQLSSRNFELQVVTGLLVAEVNVNTMCELGSGGVSLVILQYLFLILPQFSSMNLLDLHRS